jgi:phosphoribosyl-AMP cyclohydrolase
MLSFVHAHSRLSALKFKWIFKSNYISFVMRLDFKKMHGLLPVVVQDTHSGDVLMVGFMNEQALHRTINTGKATFWSRTRNCLWTKGASSGNFLIVTHIYVDCDYDTLLLKVEPIGPTCHTGNRTCFFTQI